MKNGEEADKRILSRKRARQLMDSDSETEDEHPCHEPPHTMEELAPSDTTGSPQDNCTSPGQSVNTRECTAGSMSTLAICDTVPDDL